MMHMPIDATLHSTHVQLATWRDMLAICRLEMRCFGGVRLIAGLWQRVPERGVTTWLARHGGTAAAYLIAYPRPLDNVDVPYVGGVGTAPEFQRRGIGRELMQAAFARHGALWLHVRASNTPAIRMYEALGMHMQERITHFYQNGDDALVMLRR
jgi:ribosomal protein S18 acetylase RimI-like enzyme